MNGHDDIRFLWNAFTALQQKQFLEAENCGTAVPVKQLISLQCHEPVLAAGKAAKQLHLSARQYKIACEKVRRSLLDFLMQTKPSAHIIHQVQQLRALSEAQKEQGQYNEAFKTVAAALQLTQHYELLAQEISLTYQQLWLHAQSRRQIPDTYQHRISSLMQQQVETEQLHFIYHQLLLLRYKYALCILPSEQQELAVFEENLAAISITETSPVTARIYFYLAQLLICFMLGRAENILLYNQALLQAWQQHPHLIALQPELFIRSVSGQAYTHFLAKKVALVSEFLEQYRQLSRTFLPNAWYQHWFAIIEFHTTLKVLHKTYQYEQLARFFSAQWPRTYRVLHVLQPAEKVDILMSACITLFALQQWAEAEALLLEIKEANWYLRRTDTLYFSFVFHCLILFEQREWSRLHSLINSEYHFLYRNKSLRPFEKDMLLFIKKLPRLTISANGARSLKLFLQKLNGYRQHPVHRLHFTYFDFYTWLESKLEGVSYMDLVKRNAVQSSLEPA